VLQYKFGGRDISEVLAMSVTVTGEHLAAYVGSGPRPSRPKAPVAKKVPVATNGFLKGCSAKGPGFGH
jgi:hypothetical protein